LPGSRQGFFVAPFATIRGAFWPGCERAATPQGRITNESARGGLVAMKGRAWLFRGDKLIFGGFGNILSY
jgi:hypothetical protein